MPLHGTKPDCEICNTPMEEWNLNENDILFKCPVCKHSARDIKICNANSREHAWGGDSFFDKIRNDLTFRRIKKLFLSGQSKLNVFEIGFGSGYLLNKIYESGQNVSGTEKGMLEINIEKNLKKNALLFSEDIETIKMEPNKYDLVYGIHLIEHIGEVKTVVQKVHSALSEKGQIYLLTPNGESGGIKFFKAAWWNLEDPSHVRFFSKESITRLLEENGFENIEVNNPAWDSLACDINSFMRLFGGKSNKFGILDSYLTKILDLILLPVSLLIRVISPGFSPTIEIIARKKAGA